MSLEMSRGTGFPTRFHVQQAKTQSSLSARRCLGALDTHIVPYKEPIRFRACAGWSEYSLGEHAKVYELLCTGLNFNTTSDTTVIPSISRYLPLLDCVIDVCKFADSGMSEYQMIKGVPFMTLPTNWIRVLRTRRKGDMLRIGCRCCTCMYAIAIYWRI